MCQGPRKSVLSAWVALWLTCYETVWLKPYWWPNHPVPTLNGDISEELELLRLWQEPHPPPVPLSHPRRHLWLKRPLCAQFLWAQPLLLSQGPPLAYETTSHSAQDFLWHMDELVPWGSGHPWGRSPSMGSGEPVHKDSSLSIFQADGSGRYFTGFSEVLVWLNKLTLLTTEATAVLLLLTGFSSFSL